jgi:hypothetical protein
MALIIANNAESTLASSLGGLGSNRTLVIAAPDATKFPAINPGGVGSDYGLLTLEDAVGNREIVSIVRHDSASATFTVDRGQEGTTIRAWALNDMVSMRLTAGIVNAAFSHPAQNTGAHQASAIAVAPVGAVAATNVQAAIAELDAEKAPLSGSGATGTWPISVSGSAAGNVARTPSSAVIPAGTTAERPATPVFGEQRANSSTGLMEWWNGTAWAGLSGASGGASGGGTDQVFYENDCYITQSRVIGNANLAACTITIASPAVITMTNDFVAGQPVRFDTTGALPTGLDPNGVYYVIAAGLSALAFRVSATSGGAAVNTTGTQSGAHRAGKIKNAQSAGPVETADGVLVTVPTGATWTVV